MTARLYTFADFAARPQPSQAARLPRPARQGAEVESGENAAGKQGDSGRSHSTRLPATRDADTGNGSGATSSALPPSLVATIAACPIIRVDGRQVFLLGRLGVAWRDAIGWRWAASIGAPAHDIWNTAFVAALDERAAS